MNIYIALIRGINVGGKNKVSMTALKQQLNVNGFLNVTTYINSGNVILISNNTAQTIKTAIEKVLVDQFHLTLESAKVLVLSRQQLESIIANKPNEFGEKPDIYHSDVLFLIQGNVEDAIRHFKPREGVDKVWQGTGVVYSQRVSALRTKSRLNVIVGTTFYKNITIRSWNTTIKLANLAKFISEDNDL